MNGQEQRGMLTQAAKDKAKAFLGEEITQTELRLYPYLDYCWKNGGNINPSKISGEERKIISLRREQGHLESHSFINLPTRAFYDFVQDILAECYVCFKE